MCRSGRGGFAQATTWLYELVDPQLTAVYAESLDERRQRHDSIETQTVHWKTLQSNVDIIGQTLW